MNNTTFSDQDEEKQNSERGHHILTSLELTSLYILMQMDQRRETLLALRTDSAQPAKLHSTHCTLKIAPPSDLPHVARQEILRDVTVAFTFYFTTLQHQSLF